MKASQWVENTERNTTTFCAHSAQETEERREAKTTRLKGKTKMKKKQEHAQVNQAEDLSKPNEVDGHWQA